MQPELIITPFGESADPATVRDIPKSNPSGAPRQNASWEQGFPLITMTPIAAGGIPPEGPDMNGVLRAISRHASFVGGGGQYKWSAEYVAAKGGYPKGAVIQADNGEVSYVSMEENNSTNFNAYPDSIGKQWVFFGGATSYFELQFEQEQEKRENEFNQFLINTAFEMPPIPFVEGSILEISRPTQLVSHEGQLYSVRMPASFPVVLSGVWDVAVVSLTPRSDEALRQQLANPKIGASIIYREAMNGPENVDAGLARQNLTGQDSGIPYYQGQVPGNARLFIAGIDSLTAGAGGTNYGQYFKKIMRGNLGDGGPGLQFFDTETASREGSSFGVSGLSSISENDGIFYQYSLAGKGVYSLSATNGNMDWLPSSSWKTVRVFYLKSPSGGTFKIGTGDLVDSSLSDVDTSSTETSLGFVDVKIGAGSAGRRLIVRKSVGRIAIFAGLFVDSEKGFLWGNIARGGRKLSDVAKQDSTIRKQWFSILNPSHFMLNGGANDRTTRTGSQHEEDLTTIISDVQSSSGASILIIQNNEIANPDGTYDKEHVLAKINVAKKLSVGYRDDRKIMGTYAQALANGLMLDGVHPSDKANRIRAAFYAEYVGLSGGAADPGQTPYGGGGSGSTVVLTGDLTTKKLSNVPVSQKTTAYTFGIIAGYPSCVIDLKIFCNRNGTRIHTVKRFLFSVSNGVTTNAVTGVSTPTIIDVMKETESGSTIDFTLSAEVIDSKCVVSVTPSIAIANFITTGMYAFTHNDQPGQALYES